MQDKEYRRQYYLKNKKHILTRNKLWAKNNIEKKRSIWRNYYYKNSKKLNKKKIKYRNEVYAKDPYFRLYSSIRTRINKTIKNNIKCKRTIDLLGIDVKGLWKHLKSQNNSLRLIAFPVLISTISFCENSMIW
jgi:hypothetical protein